MPLSRPQEAAPPTQPLLLVRTRFPAKRNLAPRVDHILVSQEFSDRNPERIAEVSDLRYFNDHLVDSQRSDDRGDRIVSDHAQLVAEVRLRPPSD